MKEKGFYIESNKSKEVAISMEKKVREFLLENKQMVMEEPSNADIILSLGGDGTFIQTASKYRHLNKLLFGINCGTLGYLTEGTASNYEEKLTKIINNQYIEEKRMTLRGQLIKPNKTLTYNALNDIVISKQGFEAIRFKVYVNGEFLTYYVADGLICSTPTGSTGYALSVGGAIINPCSRMMEVIPIAAHTLLNRGIVLSENDEISIVLDSELKKNKASIIFDGENVLNFNKEDKLIVTSSNEDIRVITVDKESFVEMLSRKMRK